MLRRCVMVLSVMLSTAAAAQNYPSKPVRMVAATTIGSGADVIARLLATRMSERWGQQIVVGAEAAHTSPANYAAFLQRETTRWSKVLREAGIKPMS